MTRPSFTLLSRPQCHLCEQFAEELRAHLGAAVELQIVDVDSDPELQAQYGLRIPVLLDPDGALCCEVTFDPARLAGWIDGG